MEKLLFHLRDSPSTGIHLISVAFVILVFVVLVAFTVIAGCYLAGKFCLVMARMRRILVSAAFIVLLCHVYTPLKLVSNTSIVWLLQQGIIRHTKKAAMLSGCSTQYYSWF
jgi:hypothetical protein